jgi:hypothetical protein
VERTSGGGTHCEVAHCADGTDNDGDGKIDFPHDPGCLSFEDDDESDDCNQTPAGPNCPQCGNRIDDDGDGKIDYDPPAGSVSDPGCSSASDPSEIDECIPGVAVSEFSATGAVMGNTTGLMNHFAPLAGCGFSSGQGPDQVFHYRIDQPTKSVSAHMVAPTTFSSPLLYVRRNMCGDANSQVACAANSNDLTATATTLGVGDNLYFFADGEFTSSVGTFTMQLDVSLDFMAVCDPAVTWKHCGAGLKCQSNHCVKTQCADGIDNDGDGWIDYPLDPGCTSLNDDTEAGDTCRTNPTASTCPQCGNGIDDDGDGLIDYPADPGCTDRADPDENDDCVPAAGMPSVQVTDITSTGQASGTTSGTSVFHQSTVGCGSAADPNGPEKVFMYRLTQAVSSMTVTTCTAGLACGMSTPPTCSTAFDTVIYVRKGACLNNNTSIEIGCNDDNGAGSPPAGTCGTSEGLQSYIHTGPLQPGIYFIFVDGYVTTSMGGFHVSVTTTP